jgi:2-C-methyl-D-erythritol 4-phosphate cytidylyltransferase
LTHALEALVNCSGISAITVMLSEDDELFGEMIAPEFPGVQTAVGGASRAESVFKGLLAIKDSHPETNWVLVHDAARPCLPGDCVRRLLRQGLEHPDGAILAIPVRDTLKQDDGSGHIERTVSRKRLWAAQTPQLFPLDRLLGALKDCLSFGVNPTDEAAAMERQGARPLLVMGCSANVKITYPDDLPLVETWLEAVKNGERR